MKRIAIFTAALLLTAAGLAQQPAQQPAPVAPTPAQVTSILTAVQASQAALWASAAAADNVQKSIEGVRKALGLDPAWDFNFQLGKYVPPAPKPAEPAAEPAAAAPKAEPARP